MISAFLADRFVALAEVQALEADVAAAERRHGVIPELLDLRRRLDVVRGAVLAQMTVGGAACCATPGPWIASIDLPCHSRRGALSLLPRGSARRV